MEVEYYERTEEQNDELGISKELIEEEEARKKRLKAERCDKMRCCCFRSVLSFLNLLIGVMRVVNHTNEQFRP